MSMKMTDDIKELQELAKYYQNCAEYYHEKATRWHKQSDEDEAERPDESNLRFNGS